MHPPCNKDWRTCGKCGVAFDDVGNAYPSCSETSLFTRLLGNDMCPNAPDPEVELAESNRHKEESKKGHKMTAKERSIVFNYSTLCSACQELYHAINFFNDGSDEEFDKEVKEANKLITNACIAAEKARLAVEKLADKYTNWEE